MELDFIPIDYESFDYEGKTYVKVIGRTSSGKRVCVVDSFNPYFWAILKDNVSDKRTQEIIQNIEKIKVKDNFRQIKVIKAELKEKNFLGRRVKAIKIHVSNHKDIGKIAEKLMFKEIEKIRQKEIFIAQIELAKKYKKPIVVYVFSYAAIIGGSLLLWANIPAWMAVIGALLIGVIVWLAYFIGFERKAYQGPMPKM